MYSSGNIDARNWVHLFESPCICCFLFTLSARSLFYPIRWLLSNSALTLFAVQVCLLDTAMFNAKFYPLFPGTFLSKFCRECLFRDFYFGVFTVSSLYLKPRWINHTFLLQSTDFFLIFLSPQISSTQTSEHNFSFVDAQYTFVPTAGAHDAV